MKEEEVGSVCSSNIGLTEVIPEGVNLLSVFQALWNTKHFLLSARNINLLTPELFFLTHSVYKMWIKQEPNTLELWNKLHFEEKKKMESIHHV